MASRPVPPIKFPDGSVPLETYERPLTGDEVVISGMSGAFPKSENTMELMENLYNKVDMIEEVNYNSVKHPGLPKYYGKLNNINKFDAQFFRVTYWQAASLDPMSRMVMENAFSAIYDSGINPLSLSGTKLGVFIGAEYTDVVAMHLYDSFKQNSFVISGCSKTMLANRVSYWIDGKGPSYGLDQGCTGSMACLEIAYNSLMRGDCDSALVGACNLCVHPVLSLNLKIAGHLCMDGKTKSFDKNGDGYARAEAISVLFLQRAKDAKRIYTEIYHIKGKYFTRPDANFLPIRNPEDFEEFLNEFYEEIKVPPSVVEYIEAYGSGIAKADANELEAVANFFANARSIKVGSVKSNMGNTEAANGMCSLTKLCIAYNKGELPANLHYSEPLDHIPAVRNGRVEVMTKNTPFSRGFTALNCLSFTGSNFHVLLKGHYKKKDNDRYKTNIPRLVLLSGREENGVNQTIDILKSKPMDPEQIALLHNIYNIDFPGHTGRSYTILDTNKSNKTVCLASSFEFYSGTKRPICFLYSGMGSQWNGMGTELLRIPIFAAAIEKCRKVLEPLGVDLMRILIDLDKSIFDNILNSMVGISAIQIGLTDVLKAMGIVPDMIIGHSIGELGCAYADECFTAEEMILASYYRGLVSIQTPFIRGSMAAIGLGYNNILPLCPPEIEVACHNSAESATISGPIDVMKEFVSALTNRGIFAREVACSNIAYHSKYISDAGPGLLSAMQKIIKTSKLRSEKWISTSIPQNEWDQDYAKYCSSEYFTNNLLNPVLFEENARLIPKDAIIIEIAPHGLLQAIVKRSHGDCVNLSLTKRGNPDPVCFLLQSIGKLYQNGLNPTVDVLYPKVEFPVSTETPMLSHLVKWEHSIDWPEIVHESKEVKQTSARDFVISIYDDDYSYMGGHVRNGINEVPESALLVLIWETLAMYRGKCYEDMSVTFYDVTFHCQVKIDAKDVLRLRIAIQNSHRFEIFTGNTHIVTGFVKNMTERNILTKENTNTNEDDILLGGENLYSLLRMRGYSYGKDFQSIHSLNTTRNTAYVKWTGEWATFLDSLLQLIGFTRYHDGISTPKIIKNLSINIKRHRNEQLTVLDGLNCYKAELMQSKTLVRCGGIELDGVIFDDKPRLNKLPDVLLTQEFIPHNYDELLHLETAISVNLQLVADNVYGNRTKVFEVINSYCEPLCNIIKNVNGRLPYHQFDVNFLDDNLDEHDVNDAKLFVVHNFFSDEKILKLLNHILKEDVFVLTFEHSEFNIGRTDFEIITTMRIDGGILALLKKKHQSKRENVIYVPIDHDKNFLWFPQVQSELCKTRRVILVSERQPYCGLLGLVKCFKETRKNNVGVVFVEDYHVSKFNPEIAIYKKQLEKKLAFNVLKQGQWGNYYYVPKIKPVDTQNVCLTNITVGDLDNFKWMEIPKRSGNVVQVSYAGLSAKDCQKALVNTANPNSTYGMDFSGVNNKGEHVMGLVASGALSSTVDVDPTLLWPVPQHWSLQDAATVPLPYIHAYYILVLKAKIKRKQSVFITGGAGALGQAVISICHSLDCTVFTTVSDKAKKEFLFKLFPNLTDENISYSRHENFFAKVKAVTKNERCDVVINCRGGALRESAMKCVAFIGTFIDISNADIEANKPLGMFYLEEDRCYKFVDLATLFKPENVNDRKTLQLLMAEGIANGTVRPLSRVVYSPIEVARAFKLVSASRNRGRALIRMSNAESLSLHGNVIPGILFSNGVQIVVCDRSDLAVELIDHLIKKGANKIIVHSNKNYKSKYLFAKAASWREFDVTINLNSENLQTKEGSERLLKAGKQLGPITGIFIVQNYKEKIDKPTDELEHLKSSFEETIMVTANLDMMSRYSCIELSNFVLISVSSQNIGSEYAISACERICEARKKVGLPALTLRAQIPDVIALKRPNLLSKLTLSTLSSLFSAMEISLRYKYSNALTFDLNDTPYSTLTEKLERILGIQSLDQIDENLTLSEINVNDMIIEDIKSNLRPVTYSTDELLDMTIACLKKIFLNPKNKNNINFDAALGAFYSHVERNEYVAVDAVIPMKTQIISYEQRGCIDQSGNHLIFIPGFDGRHQVFESIAERLKIRAVTLQLGPDLICDSIPEMANNLSNIIKQHLEISSKFYIFGYSFGVNVALEVAKLLELEGRTGVVYCLDSSPEALKSQFNAYVGNLSDTQLQNAVLVHMFHLMTSQEDFELHNELEKADSWWQKVEICMTRLRKLVYFSSEHIRTILESAYKRIILARNYEPCFQLESELVLVRGIPHPKARGLADDYNLSKYTKQPVKVFHIESDHASAPFDIKVPNIVNKNLDPNLLEGFKRINLCEGYYL